MSSTDPLSELESLRSQVADLTRALAERDHSMQDLRGQSQLLRTIIEGTAAETGDEFFSSLVKHLTSTLHVQYAVIGEVLEGGLRRIRTLAVSAGGTLADNFEYELAHTPCATALTQTFACFDRDVQATFPQFQRLADLGAESYCGVPLRTKGGAVIGLLVVMDTKPLGNSDYLQSLLGVFAPRVAVEIERRRTEQERAEALADLRNVVETAPDIMFTLDTQGNMVKWNRRVRDVTGYSPEELLNKPALAFVPPEEQTRTGAAIQRVFTEGYAELEGHLLTKEHRLIPYHWTGALLKNPHGEPIGITGIGRDVSDKKRTEGELQSQRRHLVEAQAIAHLGSWDWDINTGEVQWSGELFRIFGHEPGSIHVMYDTFLAALLPDDHDRVLAAINDALVGKSSYDIEYRIVRPNGEVRSIHACGDVHRDATGHPLSMAGTVLDITECKQDEESLRASEERWQLAVRGSNDGIWDWDIQTGEVFFSARWKAMRGYEESELANLISEWQSRIHPVDLERVLQRIDQYLAKQRPEYCEEYRVERKDGSYMWVLDRGMALWADDGTPLRMAGSETDITARKGAEEALVRSRDLLNSFVEHTPAGVAMLDKDLRYVAVSRRWVEDYRLGHQQVIGRHHYDVFPEIKDMKEWQEIHQRCLSGAVERREADHFTRANGSEDWLRWEVRPWHDITGEIGGIIMFTEVITERKQAEAAVRESRQRLQAVVEGTSDAVYVKDVKGRYLLFNSAAGRFVGKNAAEVVGHDDTFIFSHDDAQAVMEGDRAVMAGGQTLSYEERLTTADGERRTFHSTKGPLLNADGQVAGIFGVARDVTERNQAEEAIKEAELRYRTIFEQAGAGVAQVESHTGRFVQVNRRYCEIVGLTEAEMLSTTFGVTTHPDDLQGDLDNMTRLLRGEIRSFTMEKRYVRPDGGIVWVNLNVAPLWGPGEQAIHHIAIVEDITDRKQAEGELRKSEERYARATAAGKVGVWELDVVTGAYHGDPNLKALFGYVSDELSTDPYIWLNLVHPDDQSIALDHWQRIVNGERDNYNYELRMLKKDGTVIWTDVRGHAVRDHEGQVTQLFGATVDISERKQAQDALIQSERQIHAVLDALPVGVWFTDRSGKPLLANPAAKQIWSNIKQIGLQTPDNQSSWWETIGATNEPHRWALSRVLTTGVPSLGETFDLECLDGTKKVIRNSTVPVQSEAGVTLGAIVLNEDITMLRQAQAALQLTQFSVDHAVEGFFWIGPDARIFHVNDAACRMLEYTREELTTMTVHDIDPSFPPEVWQSHWEELKEKGSLTFESKHWSRTGRVLDTEVTVNYLQYEGKEYNCAIMRNIGERKQADAALRASEERYRALYDETPTMYFTLATDGTVRSVNRFGAEQLGYRVEELIGHSVLGLFHEQDKEAAVASLSECLTTPETTRHWEFRKVRKDGSMIWVRESARVGQSSAGEPVVLVTCEDVTERKRTAHESHERAQQALVMQIALLELARLDGTKPAFSDVIPHVTKLVAEKLAMARVGVWLMSEDQTELVCQDLYECSEAAHSAGTRLTVRNYPRYFAALEDSLVVAASDAQIDPRTSELAEGYLLPLGITSMMDVPIHRQGKLIGVMCYEHVGSPREWSPEIQGFVGSVGESVVRLLEAAERKRAEGALRLTQWAVDRGADMAFWIDRSARILYVNDAACQRLGYSRDELISMTIPDLDPDYQLSRWSQHWDELREQNRLRFETRHRTKLGEIFPVEIVANFVVFEGQEYNFAFSRDSTDRKRAEGVLHQRERDLRAALDEREQISQDLHDGILQSLFAVGLALEAAKLTMSPRNRKTSGAPIDQAIDQLNLVMREVRNFIAGLGSDLLQGKNLPTALKHMLASLTENQATRVRLAVEDRAAKALSTEQSLHLIRVVQEAVSNCIRHGHAPEARVSLKMLKQGVRLSIRDNGRGFNQDAAKVTGHGLVNMAARAKKVGGRFTVLSKMNEGTSIVLDLPKEASYVHR